MIQRVLSTTSRCLLVAAACMPAWAGSALAYTVCAQRDTNDKQTTVTIDNGCVSSSRTYLGHNFRVRVEQSAALITIDGDYRYKNPAGGLGTTDCEGAKKLTFKHSGFGKRIFSVIINNTYRGRIDLTETTGPACVRQHAFRQQPQRYTASGLKQRGFAAVDLASWRTRTAASLLDLFGAIVRNHPESTEGRPTMRIEMGAGAGPDLIVVEITQHGLLDDSVSAQRYVGHVRESAQGWQLVGLWKQSLCARGERAGQWTARTCS